MPKTPYALAALADAPRWLVWRTEQRGGKPTKVPYGTDSKRASATDPATWCARSEAEAHARRFVNGGAGGIGIVLGDLGAEHHLVGLDLDSAIDDDGVVADWAADVLAAVQSYCEVSPSNHGVKCFFYIRSSDVRPFLDRIGVAPDAWGCRRSVGMNSADHGPAIEVYAGARYFTVTDRHWAQTPDRIALLDNAALEELAKLIPPPATRPQHTWSRTQTSRGDGSRSAKAFREAVRVKRNGCASHEELRDALLNHADPEIAAWTREKGLASNEREVQRLWLRAGKSAPAGTPIIRVVSGERHLAANAGIDALVRAGVEFYQRGHALVYVGLIPAKTANGEDITLPGIVNVSLPRLGRALGFAAQWQRYDGRARDWLRIDPPMPVAEQIPSMSSEWPFLPLAGLVTCPTLRRDGSLLAEAGYDSETGLYLTDTLRLPPIPERPTKRDAEAALALLLDLIKSFPFADDKSRSVALSTLITPVARAALGPVVPAHGASAPAAGSGKSYLGNVAAYIATGRPCAVVTADHKPEETDKRLIGELLNGHALVSLDNIRGVLASALLCQAIEQPMLDLRPLGTSKMVEIPNTVTILINGNNLVVAEDLVRRTLVCRLDADCEAPEERTYESDPLGMVMRNRADYVAAALIIVRAYLVAGTPNALPPLPSFAGWSDRLRSALVWLGQADPVETMASARFDDPIRQERIELFQAWAAALGDNAYRVSELVAEADKQSAPGAYDNPDLRGALLRTARERRGNGIDAMRLGWWLRTNADMVAGSWKLVADRSDKTRPRWAMRKASP